MSKREPEVLPQEVREKIKEFYYCFSDMDREYLGDNFFIVVVRNLEGWEIDDLKKKLGDGVELEWKIIPERYAYLVVEVKRRNEK